MESALDVLSRAATMVQDNTNETRLTSKELPTTSWRRERRLRTGEYHQSHYSHVVQGSTNSAQNLPTTPPPIAHSQNSPEPPHLSSVSNTNAELNKNAHQISIMMAAAAAASIRPFCETVNRSASPISSQHSSLSGHKHHLGQIAHSNVLQHIKSSVINDVPLDMSVNNLKQRSSPPPPYREPLSGSNFLSSLSRPSVITQAPPKRDKDSCLVINRENDNRSSESIDEHFRRSLGNDYFALFSKSSPSSHSTKTPSPQPPHQQVAEVHGKTSPSFSILSSSEQTDVNPPPAYPSNFPSAHSQKNSEQAQQAQIIISSKTNSVLLTPVSMTTQKKPIIPSSPPLPLVVRSVMHPQYQPPLVLTTKTAGSTLTSPRSPTPVKNIKLCKTMQAPAFKTSCSRTTSPLPLNQQQLHSLKTTQQQPKTTATAQFSVIENSSLSPSIDTSTVAVPNSSPSIIRIKTEPGLHSVKLHNPTPPSSPTSITCPSNSSINNLSQTTPKPLPSPKASTWKPPINSNNANADILASVDDHFAKALGDTWKKLQESKEIRK